MNGGARGGRGLFDRSNPFGARQIVVGVVIAALGLAVTAFIGFGLPGNDNNAQPVQSTGSTMVETVTETAVSSPGLSSASGSAPVTTTGTKVAPTSRPTTAPPPVHPIWHAGKVMLMNDSRVNLDAPADDPRWQVDEIKGGDIRIAAGVEIDNDAPNASAFIATGPPTYDTCNTSGYGGLTFSLALVDMKAGSKVLCVLTDEGRIAALKLASVTGEAATFSVTVYQKSGDG